LRSWRTLACRHPRDGQARAQQGLHGGMGRRNLPLSGCTPCVVTWRSILPCPCILFQQMNRRLITIQSEPAQGYEIRHKPLLPRLWQEVLPHPSAKGCGCAYRQPEISSGRSAHCFLKQQWPFLRRWRRKHLKPIERILLWKPRWTVPKRTQRYNGASAQYWH